MGFVRVSAHIGRDARTLRQVDFLVDTGSFYTVISPALAAAAQVQAATQVPLVLADNSRVVANFGIAYMELMDRVAAVPVAIMDAPEPLLGVTALEGLGLKVNPVRQVLEYERPYGPALLAFDV
jgi:aspartyl protease family protein